ncbi:MAG: thiamine-phosphate kinase [Alphaproteobacteria bacterium]|nr:thiamine-phosphate kinase [Alphaproteobacteria bacterium]
MNDKKLKDFGEKRLLAEIILPMVNPGRDNMLAGDDCAIIPITKNRWVSISTDRVPSDLISFKLGILDYFGLGYYLAVLNISDICASGARPVGLLLNLAFPGDFFVEDLQTLYKGIIAACDEYDCKILGGDFSDSAEMNLTATSVGIGEDGRPLYRNTIGNGDVIYCSDYVGLTPTAFLYFLTAKPQGILLSAKEEEILKDQFRKVKARKNLSELLAAANKDHTVSCMDNTDGVFQSFNEMSAQSGVGIELDAAKLPIHELSHKLAGLMGKDVYELVLGAGADFQLLGAIDKNIPQDILDELRNAGLYEIGIATNTESGVYLNKSGQLSRLDIPGWNYYTG